MKLINVNDDPHGTGLINRMESEGGLVEVGVYPVLFGARIRAGFVGFPYCEIDWCCGDSQRHLNSHMMAVCLFLMRREENMDCFDGLPETSRIKPCWKDEDFEKRLTEAMLSVPGITQSQGVSN